MSGSIRIGNCSGFYGDRLSAMREQLEGGRAGRHHRRLPRRAHHAHPRPRPAQGRLASATPAPSCARSRTASGLLSSAACKIVSNAGGLNPAGLADRLREVARGLGLDPAIAHVEGDDVRHLGFDGALTANAYLGGFGIASALRAGADVVVTGRVTDASLVVGPAIAHHGWGQTSYDELAGAVVAGHVIECGAQATGGNFSGFLRLPRSTEPLGFPIAEVAADGSSVITKHDGTRRRGHPRHCHRPARLRDPVRALPRPRRHHAPRHHRAQPGGARPGRDHRRARGGPARAAQGLPQRARRLAQLRRARADRTRRRGEGGVGARPARVRASPPTR